MKAVEGFIKLLLCLLVSIGVIYILLALARTLLENEDYLSSILSPYEIYQYVLTFQFELHILLLIVLVFLTVCLFSLLNRKKKGYEDASDHGAYGSAKFSSLEKVRRMGYVSERKKSIWSEKNPLVSLGVDDGIILGKINDELVIIPERSKLDNRNVLLVGSSGSGKGQSFIINNIINNRKSSIVVTDPKGELHDLTADIKRDQGYKVFQIDFLNLVGDGFNPLDYIEDDLDAKRVALTIARNSSKDDKEDHWFTKAVDLLTGIILYVKSEYKNPSIPVEVKRVFNAANEDPDYLYNLCEEIGEEHIAYQYLKDSSVATGNERQSVFSTFTKQVGIFSSQKVSKLTRQSDFDFYSLQEQPSILYIKIPIKDNPVASLTATFFDQLLSTLYKIGDQHGSKLKIPTILLLDEFANIGKLNDYDNILSTCRGYNLSLITVVQDFAQLESMYNKEKTRTIISNHDTTLFLRTKDAETAKYFERLAGDTTIRYSTTSKSGSGGWLYYLDMSKNTPSSSQNEQLIKKPLISEAELLNMNPPNRCYAFFAGQVLPMEKAYQSLIYKGFITGIEKVKVDGIEQFPYVYPENRERYISHFKFQPYREKVVLEPQNPIPTEPKTVVEEVPVAATVERTPQKTSVYEEKLDILVSDFISKVKKNAETTLPTTVTPINVATSVQATASTSTNVGGVEREQEIIETIKEEAKSSFNDNPSQDALNELKGIVSFHGKVNEINNTIEDIEVLNVALDMFEIETPKIEFEELPM